LELPGRRPALPIHFFVFSKGCGAGHSGSLHPVKSSDRLSNGPGTYPGKPAFLAGAGFWTGLGAFALVLLFFDGDPERPQVSRMAAVAVLMAVWWLSEAVPLAATSLVPLVMFPLLGISSSAETAPSYMDPIIFLFLGGFLIALSMEKWNLHRRIALNIIGKLGGSPEKLIFGFLVASASLSMWISNTATAVMMLPIGLAIISRLEESSGAEGCRRLAISLMLAIAYGCSIGGVTTLIGTPTNLVLASVYSRTFPGETPLSFGQWFLLGLPLGLALGVICWGLLAYGPWRPERHLVLDQSVIQEEKRALGKMGFEEKAVFYLFSCTALLWVFRADLVLGEWRLPGWSRWSEAFNRIDDGTVAISMALLLFVIPASKKGERLLDADVFRRVPWAVILLFGGGFALASGFTRSGLTEFLAGRFVEMGELPFPVTLSMVCLMTSFLTELTSNTASAQMLLPVLASLAQAHGIHPLLLMIPAALSASMAFMLPVATPPNAIVFGSQRLRVWEMAAPGFCLNLAAFGIIFALTLLLLPRLFL
jgi:solute carrier family 13 (sodium-dependent dicarboxylate transporter), member 2/3/5